MFLNSIKKRFINAGYTDINVDFLNGSIVLTGEMENWEDIVSAGRLAVDRKHSRGVVNNIKLKGYIETPMRTPILNDNKYNNSKPDVLVIGGGIVGCSILRELSRWNIDALLVEKEYDVGTAQSSRNDGMIHPGIDLKAGSLKHIYNSRGNSMYPQVAEELDFPIRKCGQYVVYLQPIGSLIWPFIKLKAKKNGIEIRRVPQSELQLLEPNLGQKIYGGTYFPNVYVISPYETTIAFAENAIENGCEIALNTAVLGMKTENEKIVSVQTNRGTIYPKVVINAAGVFSDKIAEMAGDRFYTIHPRKGQEIILDKKNVNLTRSVVGRFGLGSGGKSHSKGGGIVSMVEDNILIGPNADETPEREDHATTPEGIKSVFEKQQRLMPQISQGMTITYFAGCRASTYEEEFIVEASKKVKNFVQAAGIQSPGITAAPAIAQDITKFAVDILKQEKEVLPNAKFNPTRKGIPNVKEMSLEDRDALIKQNPKYGTIICRCEEISEGEIIDAMNRPLKVASVDAIKRRVRAGMGRCQGGFCSPLVTKLIAENQNIPVTEVTKKQAGSEILKEKNKEAFSIENKTNINSEDKNGK